MLHTPLPDVREAEVVDKRVLVRADFNEPLNSTQGAPELVDDARIRAALPTLELLHAKGAARITLVAHLGRPGGQAVEALRLAPVERRLRELTAVPFELQENLRFDPREEANDETFARELAGLGDVFVNEAFADSHRNHASIVGVPKLLPSFAGLRFMEEAKRLGEALKPPQGAVAIVGGAKFETKEPLLVKLLGLYDRVLLGGALANDLLRSRGLPIGASATSSLPVPVAVASNERLVVPTDAVLLEEGSVAERVGLVVDSRAGERIVDIGPTTAALWGGITAAAPFVLWNGPMGVYEQGYTEGTQTLARALAGSTSRGVVGGGDTLAAFPPEARAQNKNIFFSTAGGAMLEFLANGTLPGIAALTSSKG